MVNLAMEYELQSLPLLNEVDIYEKNMINLVVWIREYQELETNNSNSKSRRQKQNQFCFLVLGFLDLPKNSVLQSAHYIFSSSRLNIFFLIFLNFIKYNCDMSKTVFILYCWKKIRFEI